jgi:MFS family permease
MNMSVDQVARRSPLRRPVFARLWLGLMLSRLGDAFTVIALLWFVLQLTSSGVAIGLVVLCFQLPTVLSSPMLGKLLDRYSPRAIMALDNAGRCVLIAMMPILYWSGLLQLWMVYALTLLAGVLSPATEVGMRVVVPRLVKDEELERANAMLAVSWDFATLVGPAIAGVLIGLIGAPNVLLFDAASFLLMCVMVLSVSNVRSEEINERERPGSWFGFGTIARMRVVLVLSLLTLLFLFVQGMTEVAIPVYSQKTLLAGATGYGLLMSSFGLGSLLSLALLSQFWTRSQHPGRAMAAILLLSGALLVPLLFVHALPVAMLVMGLAGCAAAPYYIAEQSVTQRLVPARLRGEVFGARGAVNVAGYPLGGAIGGLLMGFLTPPLVIGSAALLCMTMGVACLAIPRIRTLSKTDGKL